MQRYGADGSPAGSVVQVSSLFNANSEVYRPQITALANGGVVVTWQTYNTDIPGAFDYGVSAQVFNAAGNKVGGEILVPSFDSGSQTEPDVAALSDGGFIVVWRDSNSFDGSGDGVFAQRYSATGAEVGGQFQVNGDPYSTQGNPSVIGLSGGGFAVAFAGYGVNSSEYGIWVQLYDAAGRRIDGQVRVDEGTSYSEGSPRLSQLANGDLVVIWSEQDRNGSGVFQRVVGNPANWPAPNSDPVIAGLPGQVTFDEAAVNAGPQLLDPNGSVALGDIDSADFAGGRLTIDRVGGALPEDLFGIRSQGSAAGQIGVSGSTVTFGGQVIGTITATGTSLSVTFTANASQAAVEALLENLTYANPVNNPDATRDIRLVLTDGDGGVTVRTITIDVTPQVEVPLPSGEVRANTFEPGDQSAPAIAALSGGGHVVVWNSYDQDASSTYGIRAQIHDATGQPVGVGFAVNSGVDGSQSDPKVAALSGGGFVVTWTDDQSRHIEGQRFDAAGQPVGAEFQISTETYSPQTQSSVIANGTGFAVVWSAYNDETFTQDIRLQRFNATGTKVGGEVAVTSTSGYETSPEIAVLGTGFVVVWADRDGPIGNGQQVWAQVTTANGTPTGSPIPLGAAPNGYQTDPQVAALAGGGFAVTWTDASGADGSSNGVYTRVFAANGTPLGGDILVNTDITQGDQSEPDILALPDGGFVVSFTDFSGAGASGYYSIYTQSFNADGSCRDAPVRIDSRPTIYDSQSALTGLGGGTYGVTFTSGDYSGTTDYSNDIRVVTVGTSAPVNVAPVLGDLDFSVTLPVTGGFIDRSVDLSDADSANFAGGALTVAHLDFRGAAGDVIGVGTTPRITVAGANVSFDGTVIGTISAVENGLNGAALRITFNAAATVQAVRVLVEALTFSTTAASIDRTLGITVSDGDGAISQGESVRIDLVASVTPPVVLLDDMDGRTVTEDQAQAGVVIDATVDFRAAPATVFTGGRVEVTYQQSDTTRPGGAFETLSVQNQGSGAGQIGLSGSNVSFGGVAIGTIDATENGQAGNNLHIVLNASATAAAIDALLQAITYATTSEAPGATVNFNVRVTSSTGTATTTNQPVLTITPEDDGGPVALGGEELVNGFTANDQTEPVVAALSDGGYVVVWTSYGQDPPNDYGIFAQRYDSDGAPVGGEVPVNATITGGQADPVVTGLTGGGYVIGWYGQTAAGDSADIAIRIFDAAGNPGPEIQANLQGSSTQYQPSITALPNGNFVVAWASQTSAGAGDGAGVGAIARIFTPAGVAVTNDFVLNTFTTGSQSDPSLSGYGSAGGFVAVWESSGQDGASGGIYGQRFDAAGVKVGTEFRVNTTTAGNQTAPEVTRISDGGFVVVWQSPDASGYGVWMQRYSAAGAAVGGEVLVNEYQSSTQYDAQVIGLSDGGWVVAWTSDASEDGSGSAVIAQRFRADGSRADGPVIVNQRTESTQWESDFAALSNGRFVGVYASYDGSTGGDGDRYGVYQRLFGDAGTVVPSADPVIDLDLSGGSVTFAENAVNGAAQAISLAVSVADLDSANFAGGRLTITRIVQDTGIRLFNAPDNGAQDELVFIGSRVTLSGTSVLVNGTVIGTLTSNGLGGAPLSISFTAAATPARVEILLESLGYRNTSDDPAAVRSYRISLTDGDGGSAKPVTVTVNVTPTQDGAGPAGGEEQVNTETESNQGSSAAAGLTGGGHVVVWQSQDQDDPGSSTSSIHLQLHDANGKPIGPEQQVNTTFSGAQANPDVVALSNGGFVVGWEGNGPNGTSGVFAQIFDAQGNRVGGEFPLNAAVSGFEGDVHLAARAGSFLAVWSDSNGDASGYGIRARLFANDGTPAGVDVQINTTTASTQDESDVAATATGYVVVWQSYDQDANNTYGVYARLVDANGAPQGGEIAVNTTVEGSQTNPSIAALAGGGFVVVWEDTSGRDGSGAGIFGQRFDAAGVRVGGEFQVNEFTSGTQSDPEIIALPGGGFVVAWTSAGGEDGSGYGVLAQQYDALGNRIDGQQQLNVETASTQWEPTLAVLQNGGFLAAWSSYSSGQTGDGDQYGVFQRIFGDPADYNDAANPVLQAVNATLTVAENTLNAGPVLIDANNAVALSDLDSANFAGGWVRVDNVISGTAYADQINAPDNQTQDVLGLRQAQGITIAGSTVSVNGTAVGTIVQAGQAGARFEIALNANATRAIVELLLENLTYRNVSDDPESVRTLRIQVADGDGGVSAPDFVTVTITPEVDGASPVFGERQANTYETSFQENAHIATTDEGFVMVWQSYGQDAASTYGIYGQRFDANGNAIGSEFRVNTTTAGEQIDARVEGLSGGGFVVTWTDRNGTDGSSYGVFLGTVGNSVCGLA